MAALTKTLAAGLLLATTAALLLLPGYQAERFLHSGMARIQAQGLLQIEAEPIRHGWLESRITTRVRLADTAAASRHSIGEDHPLVLVHRVRHVPVRSGGATGFRIDTRIDPDAPRQPAWVSASGLAASLRANTLLRLDGSSVTDLHLPGVQRTLAEGLTLSWAGMDTTVHLDADFRQLQGTVELGALRMQGPQGALQLGASQLTLDLQQDNHGLWLGEQQLQGGPVTLQSHTLAGEPHGFSVQALQLDLSSRLQVSGLMAALRLQLTDSALDALSIPRLLLDVTVADVPPEPVYALHRRGQLLPPMPDTEPDPAPALQARLLEPLLLILQGKPRLQVRPFQLETTAGTLRLDADLRMLEHTGTTASTPAALLQRMVIDLKLDTDRHLLQTLVARQHLARLQAAGEDGEAAGQQARALSVEQVEGWIQLGFLVPYQDKVRSQLQLERGELRVNGVAMGPVTAPPPEPSTGLR